MGIYCEINLHKPSNGIFVGTAGNIISGVIKYAVDEGTTFSKITVSLKGLGAIYVEMYYRTPSGYRPKIDKSETYLDLDYVVSNNEKGFKNPNGSHEIPFIFELPCNVPPSVKFHKYGKKCQVKSRIKYYVRIKFNQKGVMNFTKRFKKPIIMVSGIIPRLPTAPVVHGSQKNLTKLFSRNSSTVNIKANILNSVLKSGDKIELEYELVNNTNLEIKGVETKLVEVHTLFFKAGKPFVSEDEEVPGTDSKTATVKSGETQVMQVEITIPYDRRSAEFSKIYSREYYVFITAILPVPHRNHVLEIPLQIGDVIDEIGEAACTDVPPSYWEAMNEYNTDKIDLEDEHDLDDVANTGNTSEQTLHGKVY